MRRISLAASLLCAAVAVSPAAFADGSFATIPYHNLFALQQKAAALRDLNRLDINIAVSSSLPNVGPDDIKLVMHRASGALQELSMSSSGQLSLPVSDELQKENPPVVSNQPGGSLNATLTLDLLPLSGTRLKYDELLAGVQQIATAMSREPLVASMFTSKPKGLLLFYNGGAHTLTLHDTAKGHVVKSEPARPGKGHLKGMHIGQLLESTTVIFVKLDPKLLKSNPTVDLDTMPDEILPAT
jgi:hypothetical protein